ncbi:unnamed protein product, partial [Iphiclides podalirius]
MHTTREAQYASRTGAAGAWEWGAALGLSHVPGDDRNDGQNTAPACRLRRLVLKLQGNGDAQPRKQLTLRSTASFNISAFNNGSDLRLTFPDIDSSKTSLNRSKRYLAASRDT